VTFECILNVGSDQKLLMLLLWSHSHVMIIVTISLHVCMHACMCNGRSAEAIWPRVKLWLISELNHLEATGRVLLKARTIQLATGRNTSSLGMLDQIEWRCRLTCYGR